MGRSPRAAASAMTAIRFARVSARRARTTQESAACRTDRGYASHASRAGGRAARASARSAGTSSRSTGSKIAPAAVGLRPLDDSHPGRRHAALDRQSLDPLPIRLRPRAARLARSEVLLRPEVVDRGRLAVDPAETQGFLHGGGVLHALTARCPAPHHEPDAGLRGVIRLQPTSPRLTVLGLDHGRFTKSSQRDVSSIGVADRAASWAGGRDEPSSVFAKDARAIVKSLALG